VRCKWVVGNIPILKRASAVGEAESAVDCSRKRDEGKECV
jgi:hypothetical protein